MESDITKMNMEAIREHTTEIRNILRDEWRLLIDEPDADEREKKSDLILRMMAAQKDIDETTKQLEE